MPIISERRSVIVLANCLLTHRGLSKIDAAAAALREHFSLSESDGIWGQSDAAICMGQRSSSEDENLFSEIAADVARSMD